MSDLLRDLINEAAAQTDNELQSSISSLTRLNDAEIQEIMAEGISKQDLVKIIKEIKDATKSNRQKATTFNNINGGVEALIGIASKIL